MTLAALLHDAVARLRRAGISSAALDARLLLQAASGLSREAILLRPDAAIEPTAMAQFDQFLRQREAHQSVARILGGREFYGRFFALNDATLEPRPDSETMIEVASKLYQNQAAPNSILEFGVGSGCLLITLAAIFRPSLAVGVDCAAEAARMAASNATRHGVAAKMVVGDWGAALDGSFDLIISNPPYIASQLLPELDKEVRDYDPLLALDGGADGLAAYRVLASEMPRLLAPAGLVLLEIGYDQAVPVSQLFTQAGLAPLGCWQDLGARDRVLAFRSIAAQ